MKVQSQSSTNNLAVKGVKSIILDIGGIILDDSDQVLWETLDLPEPQMKELNDIIYHDPRWLTEVMTGKLATPDYMRSLMAEHPEYAPNIEFALSEQNFDQLLPLYQPNLDLIKRLHEAGKYKMYWLSNMEIIEYDQLKTKGILDLLDGGVYSCKEHCRKPEAKFYQILFDRYQLDPRECVFFDDRKHNLATGEELGMRGILVPSLTSLAQTLQPFLA